MRRLHLAPALATGLAFAALCSVSRAQSLVQLTFAGEIDQPGGARVRAEISFTNAQKSQGDPGRVNLDLHVAEHTAAADFVGLLARQLEALDARIMYASGPNAQRTLAHLFIDNCLSVTLHLGHGMSPTVTLCESMPTSVRIVPPVRKPGNGRLIVAASTWHAHTQEPGDLDFEIELDAGRPLAMIADVIVTRSIQEGWLAERVNHEIWRPSGVASGARVLGTSIELLSTGADWQIEVTVGPPVSTR